jgi:NADPH2:quinone reductase
MAQLTNHRIVAVRRGGPDVLRVLEEDLPEPGPGEVRLKVLTAGVSAFDVMIRSIWFPGNPSPPFTPGEDVVGEIDQVGEGVTTFEPGQRVAAWTFGAGGGYSEFVCLPVKQLVPVPDGLDSAVAVAVVVNYLTAHLYLNETAGVRSGDRMLVHGAAGGLGTALLELGGLAGAEMYGTASDYNHELVTKLGAVPIDYRRDDFVERIHALTGDGVDVVFDPIGGARQLWRSHRTLRKGGRLVPLGSVATATAGMKSIPLGLLAIGAIKLIPDGKKAPLSPNMMKYPRTQRGWYRNTLTELLDMAATGAIEPVIADRIPLQEAARAHELLERGGYAGKVVLTTA